MSDQEANIIGVAAQQIVQQAKDLGLIWTLQLASVASSSQTAGVTVVLDGDTVTIAAVNMTGSLLSSGDRVYCITVPQSGNFIVGPAVPTVSLWGDRRTLAATTVSVSLNVPSTLRSVRLKWQARCTSVAQYEQVRVRVNNSSAAVYGYESLSAFDAIASASLNTGQTSAFVGYASGSLATSGIFGTGEVLMQGWDLSGSILSYTSTGGVVTGNGLWNGTAGRMAVTSPWTSLQIFPNAGSWVTGSDFQVEGITS